MTNLDKKNMDNLLDEFFDTLEVGIQQKFPRFIVNFSEVRGSFYLLIKKPRGKTLGDDMKRLCEDGKYLSEKVYMQFSNLSKSFQYRFFTYFKLVKCYGNYQYHFLVVRKDCEYES